MEHHCQNEVNPKEVKTKFEIHSEVFWFLKQGHFRQLNYFTNATKNRSYC
jgi:hypothetical protein